MYCSEHVSNWLQIQWLNFISFCSQSLIDQDRLDGVGPKQTAVFLHPRDC